MALNEILDKTLFGVSVTQTAFKRAICEALEGMTDGSGKVQDLIAFVGPEWDTAHGRKILAKTLINLAGAGVLKRDPDHRGVYMVSNRFKRSGVSVFDQMEQSILDSIRKRGGMARARDILDDHGLRQHGDELREVKERANRSQHGTEEDEDSMSTVYDVRKTTEFAQMSKVMSESTLIRQDCLRLGWYNLPIDELNGMTLRGEFAAYMIQATYEEFKKPNRAFTERDDFFTRVGGVYNEARRLKGWTMLEFSRRPKVHAALLSLSTHSKVKSLLDRFYSETTAGKVKEMVAAGATPSEVTAYREDRRNSREGHQFIIDILERFERGGDPLEEGLEPAGVNIHLNTPVSFYEALASELEIDPVMASRGILMLDFRGDKVRPANHGANFERRLDVQEARARRAAGEDDRGSTHGFDEDDPAGETTED